MEWLGLIVFLLISLSAPADENFKGQIKLWKRPICIETKNCPLPQPLGPQWTAEIQIKKPIQPGTSSVSYATLKHDPWSVQISMYWVQPQNREKDYFVTQSKLFHNTQGFIFECSRYDFLENIKGFPTGSCSGRLGTEQIGLVMQKLN